MTYQPPPHQEPRTPPAAPPGSTPPPSYYSPVQPPFRPKPWPWWLNMLFVFGLFALGIAWLIHSGVDETGAIVLLILAVPVGFAVVLIRALLRAGDKNPRAVVQAPSTANPPPGWYPDAHGVARWYDGARWTEFTQQAPPPPSS